MINMHGSLAEARNDKNHVDERRYANLLSLTAVWTFMMGIFNLLECIMSVLGGLGDEFKTSGLVFLISVFVVVILSIVFASVQILFRYMIWKGARKEAEKGQEKNGYLAVAVLLTALGAYKTGMFIYRIFFKTVESAEVAEFLFGLMSLIVLCELLFSVFKLRKVRREMAASASGEKLSTDADIKEAL